MRSQRRSDVSIDIYHRIYRLATRKVPINQIAVTLNLPFSTVRAVVDQLYYRQNKQPKKDKKEPKIHSEEVVIDSQTEEVQTYLDIYLLQRLRYSIVDLNGMVIAKHNTILQSELDKVFNSDFKAVALLMTNVKAIDDVGFQTIKNFCDNFIGKGRFAAMLDPSKSAESYLCEKNMEQVIPIFGTEKAFEDTAFKVKKQK
ncbi:MAG: hypothetical protein JW795_04335 [Chitinivibrionales bacterium]|nr:hypothetical protein [Chitinivibrionales bacterium]